MLNLTRPAAEYLQRQLGLSNDETEIALYSLQIITYSVAGITSICLIGWSLNCFWGTLTAALAASTLRLFTGGAHSRSPLICALLGMIVAPLLAKIAEFVAAQLPSIALLLVVLIGTALSVPVIYRLAPVDSSAKPIASERERHKFRLLAVTVTALMVLIQVQFLTRSRFPGLILAISLGIWWQVFSLTRAGHRLAFFLDNLFTKGV